MKNQKVSIFLSSLLSVSSLHNPLWARQAETVVGDQGPAHYETLDAHRAKDAYEGVRSSPQRALSAAAYSAPIHNSRSSLTPTPSIGQNFATTENTPLREVTNISNASNAVAFINNQCIAGNGLPKSFDLHGGASNDQVIRDGVNLYDTSLALWSLVENGQLAKAKSILDIYASGKHGNMELRAYPNVPGAAFEPMDKDNAYLIFNTVRADGKWNDQWGQYNVHSGPNAWLILAGARYFDADGRKDQGTLNFLKKIAEGLIRLQDDAAQGGIRFGPKQGSNAYNEINTENNISAYAAFQALYKVTGDTKYRNAAQKIENFFSKGQFYNPETRKMQTGLAGYGYGEGSTLPVHLIFRNNRWEMEVSSKGFVKHASDSMGTWAISVFGADKLDQMFGPSTAQAMWATTRANFGRATDAQGNFIQKGRLTPISGLDFSWEWLYDEQQNGISYKQDLRNAIISIEWTAGAVFAEQQIIDQCAKTPQSLYCGTHTINLYKADVVSMKDFMAKNGGAYAVGPGMTSTRNGNTGFGWNAAPASFTSMASVYASFKSDPLAWWRN